MKPSPIRLSLAAAVLSLVFCAAPAMAQNPGNDPCFQSYQRCVMMCAGVGNCVNNCNMGFAVCKQQNQGRPTPGGQQGGQQGGRPAPPPPGQSGS